MQDGSNSDSNSNGNDNSNSNETIKRRPHILLGVTGSVAAVKAPEIASRLVQELDAKVRVLLTAGGRNFWNKAHEYDATSWTQFLTLFLTENTDARNRHLLIHDPEEEWRDWKRIGDPVLHIDLRNWADILLIAPLSAHSLAKISSGLCDDTLSCVVRAWKFEDEKPLVLAPAMNTAMWEHPLTKQQLDTIRGFAKAKDNSNNGSNNNDKAVVVIEPQVKMLACGDVGDGALASVDSIVNTLRPLIVPVPPPNSNSQPANGEYNCTA